MQKVKERLEKASQFIMLWRTVNTLEYMNSTRGAEGEITGYSHSCHKVFRSRKEAEDIIEEYRITTDLVERESQDGDIGINLGDMMNELRIGQYGIYMRKETLLGIPGVS